LRRHAKASSAGSIEGSGGSRGLFRRAVVSRGASGDARGSGARSLGLTILLAGLITVLLGASVAQASNGFVSTGSLGDGILVAPARIAVDETTGNVLVVDSSNNKVDVFDSSGPGAALLTSFGAADLSSPYGIAVDQSNGDVYVTDPGNTRIMRYETDGAATPTYTPDAGYASPAASPTPGSGAPDGTIGTFASAIAVDPTNGNLLVADRGDNRVSRFTSAGAFVSDFDGSDSTDGAFSHLEDVVLSPAGLIFVSDSTAPDAANGGLSRVLRFSNGGAYQATLRPPSGEGDAYLAYDAVHANLIVGDARGILFGSTRFAILDPVSGTAIRSVAVSAEQLTGVVVDAGSKRLYAAVTDPCAGHCGPIDVQVFNSQTHPNLVLNAASAITKTSVHLSGTVDPDGLAANYRFEVSKDNGTTWVKTPEPDASAGSGNAPVAVEADVNSLEPNTAYLARLVASNAEVTDDATAPQPFSTEVSAPAVVTGVTTDLSATGATLRGAVNPFGLQTSYHFEYGTTSSYGSRAPTGNDLVAGKGRTAQSVSQGISGLQPGTTYHYRLVAENSAGEAAGDDETFTTLAATGTSERAYELVSPAEKESNNVKRHYGFQASEDGNAIGYMGITALNDSSGDAPYGDRWVARRSGSGWSVDPTDAPQVQTTLAAYAPLQLTFGISDDGTKAVTMSLKKLAPGAIEGDSNVYLHDLVTGTYTTMATTPGPQYWAQKADGGAPLDTRPSVFVQGTPNFDHVLLRATGGGGAAPPEVSFLPGAPDSALYDFTAGQLHIVSRDPEGTPIRGSGVNKYDRAKNVISTDGSRIVFTSPPVTSLGIGSDEAGPAYFRSGGVTRAMSESRRSSDPPGTLGSASLLGGNRDLSKVYFFSENLTDSSAPGVRSLYRYEPETDGLDLLTEVGPNSHGFQVSADGSSVYFGSRMALLPGAISGEANVYVWRNDSLSLVSSYIFPDSEGEYGIERWWSSPNGRYFAYLAIGPNTTGNPLCTIGNNDSFHCREIYRYDAVTGETLCVSCNSDGKPSGSPKPWIGPTTSDLAPFAFPRVVNDRGQVFFDSPDQLVAADTNSTQDVYEFSDGAGLRLISSGHGPESVLADISADGRDVFFTTGEQLVREDTDNAIDLYDARIGGGIPSQNAVPPTPCNGEDCRGQVIPPPTPPPGGSETTFGPGNQSSRKKARCPKGRHSQRVKGKARCVKRKITKSQANDNRRQSR
jgi:DNA-binding beta-propeller fold protein YncE